MAGVVGVGTPSSSTGETSAVQSETSAGVTSSSAEGVLAVGEGFSRIPATAILSVDDGPAKAADFTVCGRRQRPCGHQVVDCSD